MNTTYARTNCAVYALLAVALVSCIAERASADLIHIQSDASNSTENLGSFEGTIDYSPVNGLEGTLVISLTNTSVASNGGFLTGLLFNFESLDAGANASLASATHPFADTGGGSGSPFGSDYDAGAALGGDFLGGGSPNAGVAVGATGVFTFSIVASDAASLTASSFINGPYAFDFIVRFKGFVDGGSDKVPAIVVPTSGSLALATLAVLVPIRRRRR